MDLDHVFLVVLHTDTKNVMAAFSSKEKAVKFIQIAFPHFKRSEIEDCWEGGFSVSRMGKDYVNLEQVVFF